MRAACNGVIQMSENNKVVGDRRGQPGNYEVGYGRPPKEKQFKKGQSGNMQPRRRIKGETFKSIFTEVMAERIYLTENGRRVKRSRQEVIFTQLTLEAAKGNPKATTMLIRLRKILVSVKVPPEIIVRTEKCSITQHSSEDQGHASLSDEGVLL